MTTVDQQDWDVEIPAPPDVPGDRGPATATWRWTTKSLEVVGAKQRFVGFYMKAEFVPEDTAALFDELGVPCVPVRFSNGSEELHYLASGLEVIPLTRGIQTFDDIGSDRF